MQILTLAFSPTEDYTDRLYQMIHATSIMHRLHLPAHTHQAACHDTVYPLSQSSSHPCVRPYLT